MITFEVGEGATVDIYYDKDTYEDDPDAEPDETDVTSAYVRAKGDSAIDNSGNGEGSVYIAKESDLVNGEMPEDAAVYTTTGEISNKTTYYSYQVTMTDPTAMTYEEWLNAGGDTSEEEETEPETETEPEAEAEPEEDAGSEESEDTEDAEADDTESTEAEAEEGSDESASAGSSESSSFGSTSDESSDVAVGDSSSLAFWMVLAAAALLGLAAVGLRRKFN